MSVPSKFKFSEIDPALFKLVEASDAALLDPTFAVYTNRDLDLTKINLVGFDMDYTLVRYHQQAMEYLQYNLTIEYLIDHRHYPSEIRKLSYDPRLIIRGLVVDKNCGNLLKMDIHGHVWRAMYGRKQLTQEAIEKRYANQKIKVGSQQFTALDTLFAMPEACLYCNLIDYFEEQYARGESINPIAIEGESNHDRHLNTAKLFDDVRQSIDIIHSNGSLKSTITKDMPAYIEANSDIALTLHKLRSVGKKLFLLTNSHWNYTNIVMTYILENQLPEYSSWRSYFDIIIVGSSKPSFFIDKNPFFEIDTTIATSSSDINTPTRDANDEVFDRSKVYLSGNIFDFERMAQCRGEDILYVGDHIYGDILRSKKESLWRTCLVVDELATEIELVIRYAHDIDYLSQLNAERLGIDTLIGQRRALLAHIDAAIHRKEGQSTEKSDIDALYQASRDVRREMDKAKKFLHNLDKQTTLFQDELERRFHPIWGRYFREHNELSLFGAQITSYACIYTGKLTNLLQYSPLHSFRAEGELMCHDRTLLNSMQFRKARLHAEDAQNND